MSENGEIYTAGKNFTLPPALTALTNSTSVPGKVFIQTHFPTSPTLAALLTEADDLVVIYSYFSGWTNCFVTIQKYKKNSIAFNTSFLFYFVRDIFWKRECQY